MYVQYLHYNISLHFLPGAEVAASLLTQRAWRCCRALPWPCPPGHPPSSPPLAAQAPVAGAVRKQSTVIIIMTVSIVVVVAAVQYRQEVINHQLSPVHINSTWRTTSLYCRLPVLQLNLLYILYGAYHVNELGVFEDAPAFQVVARDPFLC